MMKKVISKTLELLAQKLHIDFMFTFRSPESLTTRNERIIRDFTQGYSVKRLAKKYDLSGGRISQVLAESGTCRPKWKKMSKETRRMIFQWQKEGLSKAEIGRKTGVTRERVRQILQEGCLLRGFRTNDGIESFDTGHYKLPRETKPLKDKRTAHATTDMRNVG